MKNFKHGFKTTNKMKLAAVASAAIMLAPVAMSSVSTFAAGYTTVQAPGENPDHYDTYYPEYQVETIDQAAAGQNGTNGDVSSSMNQGATNGYLDSTVTAAMNAVNAIKTPSTTVAPTSYKVQATTLFSQVKTAQGKAEQLLNGLAAGKMPVDSSVYYAQLSADNQKAQAANLATIRSKYTALSEYNSEAQGGSQDAVYKAADLADKTLADTDVYPAGTTEAQYESRHAGYVATYQKLAKAFAKNSTDGYTNFISAVTAWNAAIAPKTNNGAVADAATSAATAIKKLPAGTLKTQLTKKFSTVQGTYADATADNDASKNGQTAVDKMTKAAQTAVKALNNIAGQASKATDTGVGNNSQLGVVKVNYPAGYGIQIWTAAGKIVRYNNQEATAAHPVGTAKKLPGQGTYKVFYVNGKSKVTMNGTTYYNLGGDQYIDAAYVTLQ